MNQSINKAFDIKAYYNMSLLRHDVFTWVEAQKNILPNLSVRQSCINFYNSRMKNLDFIIDFENEREDYVEKLGKLYEHSQKLFWQAMKKN